MPRRHSPTEARIEAANERGRIHRKTHPHAAGARYDAGSDRIVVDLTDGATFAFPPRLVQGLEDATARQLAEVEVIGAGGGLHWETLDVDFSVPGLVSGVFGTAKWMAARAGGRTGLRVDGRGRRGDWCTVTVTR